MILNTRAGDENARTDVQSGVYTQHYQLQPGDTVLDLGAHVGFFTEFAARQVGPTGLVIALEPQPENFDLLSARMKSYRNFVVFKAAASDKSQIGRLWQSRNNSGAHSIFEHIGEDREPLIVKTLSSADYLPNGHDKRVRFVKCDTEGAEAVILSDLLPNLVPPVDIAFEAHSESLYALCRSLLETWEFTLLEQKPTIGVCHAWRT